MPKCKKCGRVFSYLEDDYCDVCKEFLDQLEREKDIYICMSCNKVFYSEKDFNRHQWSSYYRRGFLPKAKKKKS